MDKNSYKSYKAHLKPLHWFTVYFNNVTIGGNNNFLIYELSQNTLKTNKIIVTKSKIKIF